MRASSIDGCMFPCWSKALDVMTCSPGAAFFQSKVQILQANSDSRLRAMVERIRTDAREALATT